MACMLIDYAESDEYEKCYNPLREIAFLPRLFLFIFRKFFKKGNNVKWQII